MNSLDTILTSTATGLVLWAAKEYRDTLKERRRQSESDAAALRAAELEATQTKEQRLDNRAETIFARYERRLAELEADVETLKAELKSERENRKLAEVEADVAHVRAGDAEAKLRDLKGRLSTLELEIQTVSRESASNKQLAEDRAHHITELKVRIKQLEERVGCLDAHQPEC